MNRFFHSVVRPLLEAVDAREILEIGADEGAQTRRLLDYCHQLGGTLHAIDPRPRFDPAEWAARHGTCFRFHRGLALDVLPSLPAMDVALVDGDHNWYSVFHELSLLYAKAREAGRPLACLVHDVGWPYARRDLYYDPETIPAQQRHEHARAGILPGVSELTAEGGLNTHLHHAVREGGERNGVLTAIEDFLAAEGEDLELELTLVQGLHGLGILVPRPLLASRPRLAALLAQLAPSPPLAAHLRRIEELRLDSEIRRQRARGAAEAATERMRELAKSNAEQVAAVAREREAANAERDAARSERDAARAERDTLGARLVAERRETSRLQAELAEEHAGSVALRKQLDKAHEDQAIIRRDLAARDGTVEELERKYRERTAGFRELERAYADRKRAQKLAEARTRALLASRTWKAGRLVWRAFHLATFGLMHRGGGGAEETVESGAGPTAGPTTTKQELPAPRREVDVVVTVHDALEDVQRCLASLIGSSPLLHRIVVVDDGSGEPTSEWLRGFAARHRQVLLLRNDSAAGYCRAANQGMRATTAPLLVLLNSDTVPPRGWLERLVEGVESSPRIGIVGPLSNAASWQSVPRRRDGEDWAVNPLPDDMTADEMALIVAKASARRFPRVPILNGFCLLIRREVVDSIGLFDEAAFPDGYGEENDYCLRARAAGFELAVADHAWVFHSKSKSYSHERRRELGRLGRAAIDGKHGAEAIPAASRELRDHGELAAVRQRIATELGRWQDHRNRGEGPFRVLFVLPVRGGGGGVHSIVQESLGLRQLGAAAAIAVPAAHVERFRQSYPSADPGLFRGFASTAELIEEAAGHDAVVATIFTSVKLVAEIKAEHPYLRTAYYIQDYEPWFCEQGTSLHEEALASYTRVPGMTLFAKTEWLCSIVRERHGVAVRKVVPSLDLTVYHPAEGPRLYPAGPVVISAMVRPKTPRRAPEATMELLRETRRRFGEGVEIHVFGCADDDRLFRALPRDFAFESHGVLLREEVAELLRASDVFVDASTYQAFGRTALEAMACGCAVIVPAEGGASEYARHRENSLVVDTGDREALAAALAELVADDTLRQDLQEAGRGTARTYNVERAAASILAVLTSAKDTNNTLALADLSSRGVAPATHVES